MHVEVVEVVELRFADGSPVRAASAVVPFAGGLLVAQDDATHAAWLRDGTVTPVRALPPVAGLDTFEENEGTKHLKPDLEAAFEVPGPDGAVVLLGSGSSPARTRAAHVHADGDGAHAVVSDLTALYASAARVLGLAPDLLNLEGACVVDDVVRWFQRGVPGAGVPSASVDVDLALLLAATSGEGPADHVRAHSARRYDLGQVAGVGLAVTDVVRVRDGSAAGVLLASAAAEDTDDPREDGPVVGSALAVLAADGGVLDRVGLPEVAGGVAKVEGLAVVGQDDGGVRLVATVDADDPAAASLAVTLAVRW